MPSVFDVLLEAIEREMLSAAPAAKPRGGPAAAAGAGIEDEVVRFERVMATVPHGDVASIIPAYQKMRAEMGRDFLALGLLAGGYPPDVEPFLTGRDHRMVVAAALMTYPEELGPWWRMARLLGFRQMAAMPPREVKRVVEATRQFRPRARRFVNGCVQRYVDALAGDRDAWENQVLVDGKSLDALIRYCNASVYANRIRVLRDRKAWAADEWPRLAAARELSLAARNGDRQRVVSILREAGRMLPLLYVEGTIDAYDPEIAPHVVGLMTPKQLFQRLDRLQRGGLLEDPGVRERVFAVLERAKRDSRVSPADVRRVREFVGDRLPEEIRDVLAAVEAEKRSQLGTGPERAAAWQGKKVCLIVDRSGSMEPAIVAASQLAAYLADQGAEVKAVIFASQASELAPELGPDGKPDWRATFAGVRAGGWTSIGAGLNMAYRIAADADLWVVLTDGACNTRPHAAEDSPKPDRGRVAVMWFDPSPSPGFRAWCSAAGAEEFKPQVRGGRLDFAALDDLVRLCMGGEAIREWLARVPSHVVASLLRGEAKADRVLEELFGKQNVAAKGVFALRP